MKIELLKEPLVEFANKFLCDDPKKGIALTGFYSLSNNSHNSEIHYSIIGTNQNIEDFKVWIGRMQHPIEASAKEIKIKDDLEIDDEGCISSNSLFDEDDFDSHTEENPTQIINKKLNPDFPGFNKNSVFKCEFLLDNSNIGIIRKADIDNILKSKLSNKEKSKLIIELYVNAYKDIIEFAQKIPNICYLVIPSNVFKKLASIKNGSFYLNFRRQLKAAIFSCNSRNIIPIQIILEDTITSSKKSMQDLSMIAWNFVVAQYYKTENCIPWALTDIDSDTCFIGISFHKILDGNNKYMRSSIAQAFNRDGKGLIFTGKQFEWNSRKTKVSTPHLKYDYAKELISNVLRSYMRINGHTPKRIVIHKTSGFWDSYIHKDYAEIEGLTEGIKETLQDINVDIDFVSIKTAKQKLFREAGEYPVLRGTLLKIDDSNGVLYTTGYIPYYESYPGVHIPMGLHIETIGETTLKQISEEILALTKLNFNNCNYYSSLPITLNFSHKVGEILQYLPEGIEPPNRYFYYM